MDEKIFNRRVIVTLIIAIICSLIIYFLHLNSLPTGKIVAEDPCLNNIQDPGEIDIDCGGNCQKCAAVEEASGSGFFGLILFFIILIIMAGFIVGFILVKKKGKHEEKILEPIKQAVIQEPIQQKTQEDNSIKW